MAKYLLSQPLLDQIRKDHKILSRNTRRPVIESYGKFKGERYLVRITQKASPIANYPSEGIYEGIQVITDSNGEFSDLTQVWGDGLSGSWGPIIDITSLGPYHRDDEKLKRIPDNTIVEVWSKGDKLGNTFWYCEAPEQMKPISFQAEILDDSGTEKVRIHSGYIYGRGFSTALPETTFNTSDGLWIYAQYTIDISAGTTTPNGIYSHSSRPIEITTSCSKRIVRIPIVSFDLDSNNNLIMTRWWEGDINTLDGWANIAENGDSCGLTDLTYDSEHQESAINDDGWNIDSTNEGVIITICTGISYHHNGDETLYQYTRDFTFNTQGDLITISSETRTVVEVPEPC